jgi:hypothetical protein
VCCASALHSEDLQTLTIGPLCSPGSAVISNTINNTNSRSQSKDFNTYKQDQIDTSGQTIV